MKNETLIVYQTSDFYFFNEYNNELNFDACYVHNSKVSNHLYLVIINRLPFLRYFFYNAFVKKNKYKRIILFDTVYLSNKYIVKDIRKYNPNAEIILYSWNMNTFNSMELTANIKSTFDFVYTFSPNLSDKYDLYYNPMTYYIKNNSNINEIEYDFVFLGYFKTRKKEIVKISELISEYKSKILVVGVDDENIMPKNVEIIKSRVSYQEYINYIKKTKCIIDIEEPNQDGFAIRVLEAVCFNKKIITNNKNIVNAAFYNESNILFFNDLTTSDDIKTFMDKRIVKYNNYEDYMLKSWAERMIKHENFNKKME